MISLVQNGIFCSVLYGTCRLGNGVCMVTKLALEMHQLCYKNKINNVKLQGCNVTNHEFALKI